MRNVDQWKEENSILLKTSLAEMVKVNNTLELTFKQTTIAIALCIDTWRILKSKTKKLEITYTHIWTKMLAEFTTRI